MQALESLYFVSDKQSGLNEPFETYKEAAAFYNKHLEEYENLVIRNDDKVIKMEYGIVLFNDEVVKYHSLTKDYDDYIDGSYAIDAAYIETSDSSVEFMLSGDLGTIAKDEVILRPIDELNCSISCYVCKNGLLYHNVKTSVDDDFYTYSILLGTGMDYLQENEIYYSYDNNYFYSDFKDMIDDYRSGGHQKSVNENDPYYNYYQYLPYRSISAYSNLDLDNYIEEGLGINARLDSYKDNSLDGANDYVNKSELFQIGDTLQNMQYLYGANSAMLMASSIVDSSYGKDLEAYTKKNLYSNFAFNSTNERINKRYNTVSNSVYSFARNYVSYLCCDIYAEDYAGTYFGNKAGGINVMYSLDPYYGEKCSSAYYKLDAYLGNKDLNKYSLAKSKNDFSVYVDVDLSSEVFDINASNIVVEVFAETENAYLVRFDYTKLADFRFDFNAKYYVLKDDFVLINDTETCQEVLNSYTYDFSDGQYYGVDTLEVYSENRLNIVPQKDGYEFDRYDENGVACYKQIVNVEVKNDFKNNYYLNEYLDLSGGRLKITYKDGTNKTVELNNDYIGFYDSCIEGKQDIEINYCGFVITYPVNFSIDENYDEIVSLLANLNYDSALNIKKLIKDSAYQFSISEIKQIDSLLLTNGYGYHIYNNDVDLSISGMALALDYPLLSSLIYDDTYYLSIDEVVANKVKYLSDFVCKYNFEIEDSYDISFALNYNKTKPKTGVVIQSKINRQANKVYSVYHLDDNGNICKCQTYSSNNYVQFLALEDGIYMVLSLDSFNDYDFVDEALNVNASNNSQDNHDIIRQVFLFTVLMLIGFINVFVYYKYGLEKERKWTGYKKLLRAQVSALEEKPKN